MYAMTFISLNAKMSKKRLGLRRIGIELMAIHANSSNVQTKCYPGYGNNERNKQKTRVFPKRNARQATLRVADRRLL